MAFLFSTFFVLVLGCGVDSFKLFNRLQNSGRMSTFSLNAKYNEDPNISNSVKAGRRKMGPPQRKLSSRDDEASSYGRVSVYCVASSIDLPALCTHVFRRSFGNNELQPGERPELVMTRGQSGGDEALDDDVLHVSNAPLFMSGNDTYQKISASQWSGDSEQWDDTFMLAEGDSSTGGDRSESDQLWKTRETLLMATQDIFYFDYGCVVFWGLTPREEKAAISELSKFVIDPVNPSELDDSFDKMQFYFDRKGNPQRSLHI